MGSIFWVSSMLSLCWIVLFLLLASSSPEIKPPLGQISSAELQYIQASRESTSPSMHSTSALPWKQLVTSVPFLSTVGTHCFYNYCGYLAISWIPTYFNDKFHVHTAGLPVTAVLPYVALGVVGSFAGWVADFLLRWFSRTVVRKAMNTFGMASQAIFFYMLAGLGSSDEDLHLAVLYLTLAIALGGFAYAGYWVSYLDMSPE